MKKNILITSAMAFALIATPTVGVDAAASDKTQDNKKTYTYKINNGQQCDWLQKMVTNNQTNWSEKSMPVKQQSVEKQQVAEKEQSTPSQTEQQKQSETTQSQATESTKQLSEFEQKVVELTNKERSKNGLPALKTDVELSKVAREKSNDMMKNKYFSHDSPTYGSPFDMMKQFGIKYSAAGENIAMGQRTPEEVVKGWMNSDGHRANILNKNFTHIGVGYVENGNYWTQMFISK